MPIRTFAGALVDLVLPVRCAGCAAGGGEILCAGCVLDLAGVTFAGGPQRVRPSPCPPGLPTCWAGAAYVDPIPGLLRAYKDGERRDLREVLGVVLAPVLAAAAGSHTDVRVVVMPSRRAARIQRGDAPVARLVAQARRVGIPGGHTDPVLAVGRVRDQAGLTAAERAANLGGSMRVRRGTDLRGRRILLADDVLTSGATLAEATRVVRAAGGVVVGAAVLAVTPRRTPPR